jgi:hypothetical protein
MFNLRRQGLPAAKIMAYRSTEEKARQGACHGANAAGKVVVTICYYEIN